MAPDLEATTTAAIGGDRDALERIYVALAPKVRGYFAVRGADDPDGLTNEVFVQVIRRISSTRGGWEGLRTLVFSVAHARLVDERRARARHPAQQPFDREDDDRTVASAEQVALANVAHEELLDLLEFLPNDQRSVILLRVLADLSISQTASVMAISEPGVKRLQSRGLRTLKELLAPSVASPTGSGTRK
ncbi:RNA polymerase sigma factor [Intrasporangium sp. DVR]|uniref:RNA polymerase sigma factor n=1 Tax=Intrasporangium sp. DVR TaxID=3127867 RepID=UPI00313A74D6